MLALEVVPLPVTDVDRAVAFYAQKVGFTVDVDYRPTAEFLQSECAGSGGLKEVGAVDDLKTGEVTVFA